MSRQHILVLGATGPSGILFCEAALRHGHPLTLYVRNPSKLPSSIGRSPNVTVIKGELTSEKRLTSAISGGATVLVSFLGPGPGHKGTPLANAYQLIFPLLRIHNCTRALVLSTPAWQKDPVDASPFKWKALGAMASLVYGNANQEINACGDYIASVPTADIQWTLFRVSVLTDAEAKDTKAGPLNGAAGLTVSRRSMAEWVLREMGEAKWVGRAACLWD
ncbi:hypothetical protein NX059_006986 [Plenodomus lindquistii]|nr:hypothetical protein NX059_006986 [Plenodomus lindquistii]